MTAQHQSHEVLVALLFAVALSALSLVLWTWNMH
jgi:hypothetical protein